MSGWERRRERREAEAAERRRLFDEREGRVRRTLRSHGVTRAYLFGSMAKGTPRAESDVDIAVEGCEPEHFYRLAAELERVLGQELDLVDLGHAPPAFRELVVTGGRRLLP